MKSSPFLLSALALALAGCGGNDDSSLSAASHAATDSSDASLTAVANAAVKPKMTCTSPAVSGAQGSGGAITVDTPTADGSRIYASGSTFRIAITTRPDAADTLKWKITNNIGDIVTSGSFAASAGAKTNTLTCTSTVAGYFAVSASLATAGGQVQNAGTRPNGIATFGVLPDLGSVLPAVNYTKQDQHRFGMQGFNDNGALLSALGITSTIDDRQMYNMEPNGRNTFNPSANHLDSFYTSGDVMRLVRLDGVPGWLSSHGQSPDFSYAPSDLDYYQNYMSRIGTETESIRARYYPKQSANYYQVTWEPNWKDTNANLVAMYRAAHDGLHSTDSRAVVMGPADPFPSLTTDRLKALAPLGFKNYIDGVATHGYYDAGTSPSHPPERHHTDANAADAANSLPNEMRNLRAEMAAEYKPGMKLFVTETGISYDLGSQYSENYPTPNVLFAQGAVVARTHIILLGEGADQTYVFYGADYPDEVGYGTFFDLDHSQGQFGATNLSPKPAAMAVAAMTRVLDGTTTLGPVKSTPSGVYAYSFQQVGGGKVVTALWMHDNDVWPAGRVFSWTHTKSYSLAVDAPGTSGTVQVIDSMGNPSARAYSNGTLTLGLTESPQYVVSSNATVAKAHATTPTGYVGS